MNVFSINSTDAIYSQLSNAQRQQCGERCVGYVNPLNVHVTTGGTHIHDVIVTIPKYSPPSTIGYNRESPLCTVKGSFNQQPLLALSSYELLKDTGVIDQCEKVYGKYHYHWTCKKLKLFVNPQDISIGSEGKGMC